MLGRAGSHLHLGSDGAGHAVASAGRAGQLGVVDDEDGDGAMARTEHLADLGSKLRRAEADLDARLVEHLPQARLGARLGERHKVVARPQRAKLACDIGQRVVQTQSDAHPSAGRSQHQLRDALRHVGQLGVGHGSGAWWVALLHPHHRRGRRAPKQRVTRPRGRHFSCATSDRPWFARPQCFAPPRGPAFRDASEFYLSRYIPFNERHKAFSCSSAARCLCTTDDSRAPC